MRGRSNGVRISVAFVVALLAVIVALSLSAAAVALSPAAASEAVLSPRMDDMAVERQNDDSSACSGRSSCGDCAGSQHCVWCETSASCEPGNFYGVRDGFCTDYRWLSCGAPTSIFFYGGCILLVICCMFICLCCYTSFFCYARMRRYNRWKADRKTFAQLQDEELEHVLRTQGSLHPETDSRRREFYEKWGRPGARASSGGDSGSLTISSRGGSNGQRW